MPDDQPDILKFATYFADSDMRAPLVNSPDSASPLPTSDHIPDTAIASVDVESESGTFEARTFAM